MPFTKDHYSLNNHHAQMYVRNQATAYPSGLYISKATNIKVIVDKVCSLLLI